MKNAIFPSNRELEEAIVEALRILGGSGTTSQINKSVIKILNLSDDVVLLEDENGIDTKLNYRLRWCRTKLKQKEKVENVKRGEWKLKQ